MPNSPVAGDFTWETDGDGCYIVQNGQRIESVKPKPRAKWFNSILEANGNTPLSKLSKIPLQYSVKCNIYVKLEYLNVGGSMEDRAAIRMIEVAEKNGLTKEKSVVAPASGNIAVGIALACAVKGYR
ncbi:PALP domain-containing protein, partial [Trichostrongylus colubriformis]